MSERAEAFFLRPARPDDQNRLEGLQTDVRSECRVERDNVRRPATQIGDGEILVAERNGEIAGFARVTGGELQGLFVDPDFSVRDVGKLLVDGATHAARRRGLALTLTAGPEARGFYERCGFAVEGEDQSRLGLTFRMSR